MFILRLYSLFRTIFIVSITCTNSSLTPRVWASVKDRKQKWHKWHKPHKWKKTQVRNFIVRLLKENEFQSPIPNDIIQFIWMCDKLLSNQKTPPPWQHRVPGKLVSCQISLRFMIEKILMLHMLASVYCSKLLIWQKLFQSINKINK